MKRIFISIALLIACQAGFALDIVGSKESPPSIKLGSFVQFYNLGSNGSIKLNHQSYFRRARFYLEGQLNHHWSYKAEYGAEKPGEIKNLWISYKSKHNILKMGQFKPAWNAIQNQSSRYLWFAERNLPTNAYSPGFRRTISYSLLLSQWNLTATVFVPGTQTQSQIEGPWASTQRVLYVPWHVPGEVLQLGLSNWYQEPSREKTLGYRSIPEASGFAPVNTINTSTIQNVNYSETLNAEALYEYKRFAGIGTLTYNFTPRDHASNLQFSSWALELSYLLNDTVLDYNFDKGVFRSPNNKGRAWQLALRLSDANLNSHDIRGGRELDTTIALNAYFVNHIKLGVNYIYANVSHSDVTSNGHANIILTSFQVSFG